MWQQNNTPDEAVNDQPDFADPSLPQVEGCRSREEKAYNERCKPAQQDKGSVLAVLQVPRGEGSRQVL